MPLYILLSLKLFDFLNFILYSPVRWSLAYSDLLGRWRYPPSEDPIYRIFRPSPVFLRKARKLTPGSSCPFSEEPRQPGELFVLLPCRLSQNPKPHTPPTPASGPFPLPRSGEGGGGSAGMGALSASTSSVNWLVEDDILLKNAVEVTPACPLYPQPHFLEFLLFVSTRQLMRPMLFLDYCRWSVTDSEGFVLTGIPGSQNWSCSYTQRKELKSLRLW
jgi:hypothetical protein